MDETKVFEKFDQQRRRSDETSAHKSLSTLPSCHF